MNSIIWNGVSSTTIQGLLISELPPITKPEMRTKETIIDGRDGSIIEELGYASYVKTVTIGLYGNFDINKIIKYFTGEGDIVFSNEPNKVYKAKICGRIDYTRLLRYRQASIPFMVQPFKYKLNEYLRETPTTSTTGTSVAINNSTEDKLKSVKIYGKSSQNGTPTPSAPIDIVSIADDGTISVMANSDTFDFAVPNELKGIPVTDQTLATYTDANGQMWCADEIDIVRGVYVQRIGKYVCTGKEDWYMPTFATVPFFMTTKTIDVPASAVWGRSYSKCTHFNISKAGYVVENCANVNGNGYVCVQYNEITTISEFMAYLTQQNANGKPVTITYILGTPKETVLTTEQIEIYKALQLSERNATISNDENAYMKVEYFKPFEVFNEGYEDSL